MIFIAGLALFFVLIAAFIGVETKFPRQTNDFYEPDLRRQARRMLKADEDEIIAEIRKRKAVK